MRKYLTMVVLLFISVATYAQQHSVKGTVVDQNGYPVIGMTVLEQGTQNGTTTDIDGNYQITVSSGSVSLEFTALGYQTVVEAVNNRAIIDVTSAEEAMVTEPFPFFATLYNRPTHFTERSLHGDQHR